MDTSPVRAGLAALRRVWAGPDYPPARPSLRRWPRLAAAGPPLALLALLGFTLITAQFLLDERKLPTATAWLLAALTVAPLPILLARPLWAWRIMFLGQLLGTTNRPPTEDWPWSPSQVLVILAVLVVVAVRVDRAVLAWLGLFSLLPIWIFVPRSNQGGVILLFVVVLVLGDLVRRNVHARRALAEQAERSELEQARRAVLEERTRIAREMHDVVAHHMSMIAVQAETAPYRVGPVPEAARTEFLDIAGSAREALTELRRLLGVLRSDADPAATAPQPGMADVPDLVAAAERAGMAVRLDGPPPDAPDAVGLAAYRIVQEALANAARHAPGAAVTVRLREHDGVLAIAVRDTGGPPAPAQPTSGHGLTGMRERARLLGGTFSAGGTADGFAVTAELPLGTEDPTR
ncbi:sensor histidine kinase [Micromonospora sp. NPDC049836]|uniref:sensor histidine kinase n=1 Tax=Micromonospora sp. NPDC049836 TaxID=3364274 RepID=UPI0037A06E16